MVPPRKVAAGSLYLRILTVFSAFSAVEIEEGIQAHVSVMRELSIGSYCAVTSGIS